MKYILLELKAPSPMSAISGTYNRGYNVFIFCQMFPLQQGKRNIIITNKNGK